MSTTQNLADHTLRAAIANGKMNRRAWMVTGMLVLFQIVNFADKAVLGLVADPAMRELGLTAGQFGFIGSAFFFLFAIVGVIVGFLAGKVSTRWILLTMGIAWAVLQFPMLFGGGAAILLVTRILLGGAEGPATPISLQHAHGWFNAKERGLPSSVIAAGSTLGPILAAPALAWIIANPALGWRWAFGFLGIFGLLWSVAWLLLGRDGPYSHSTAGKAQAKAGAISLAEDQQQAGQKPEPVAEFDLQGKGSIADSSDLLKIVPIRRVLGSWMFVAAVLAGAGCFWAQGFLTTWSPKYLGSVVALTPEMIGLVSTFPWVIGAIALLVLGFGSRYLMKRGVTVRWAMGALFGATLLISGVCFSILPFLSGYAAVAMLTLGAGTAMIYPLAPTAIAFSVCSRQRAALMATLTGLASVGGVVAPAMVGGLMDSAGYIPSPKGVADSAEMAELLAQGMNASFGMIGIYLVVVGIFCVLMLNPDRTARKLQTSFTFTG
ncbi:MULTISPECIES: MFS transporter [Micrococcaceae]|uniref:MFS transporter n=1 Tax=Micrococcaceae TaxID=1268 RepID=UPI000CFCE09C|nr:MULTISPECIES: MFS transporter [unclassified Arthrobacter]PQZ86296.1 MFS transporter [Arthrobacter sp. MYb222]PRB76980.1 MFS transporter [Arthrobacter sp. MYb214]